jgi:hypothetical protein
MLNKSVDYLKQQDHIWYIKWGVSVIMLVGMALGRGTGNVDLLLFDTIASWIGAVGWMYVGIRWNDRAIILVNLIMACINTIGIMNQLHLI